MTRHLVLSGPFSPWIPIHAYGSILVLNIIFLLAIMAFAIRNPNWQPASEQLALHISLKGIMEVEMRIYDIRVRIGATLCNARVLADSPLFARIWAGRIGVVLSIHESQCDSLEGVRIC